MRPFLLRFVLGCVAIHCFLCGSLLLSDEPLGKELFDRRWVAHDQRSLTGDGLGPMHNATSCVACHEQNGAGGAGGRDHNVDLISVSPATAKRIKDAPQLAQQLIKLHPGFHANRELQANLVLHRFGPEGDYFSLRAEILGIVEPRPDDNPARRSATAAAMAKRRAKQSGFVEILAHGEIVLCRTQRNTPALWGAGLIDSIPTTVLEEVAASQTKEHPGLSGRVPRASSGGAGRFGWRGQTETLREFVLAACANELGLQTKDHAQAVNPLATHYKSTGEDMSPADVEALVAFVANLPKPIAREPKNETERQTQQLGRRTFERIGCAGCHSPQLGKIDGIFSDLLLHDMGSGLEDPVEAIPATRVTARAFGGYSGSGSIFATEEVRTPELTREWRTPPLWGIANSAPYMHDGRADSLVEAIACHGGEATAAAQKYRELDSDERIAVLSFLKSLISPPPRPL